MIKFENAVSVDLIGLYSNTAVYNIIGDSYAPENLLVFNKSELRDELKAHMNVWVEILSDHTARNSWNEAQDYVTNIKEIIKMLSLLEVNKAEHFYIIFND